ncbi:MAG: bestrophin family ion channel [Bryobacteraceae bacterium]
MIDYDPHSWLDHFFDIKGSMVREILGRVAVCVAFAVLVVLAYQRGVHLAIPSTLHALVGLALGLLLVFRTNASYDRFWEGRKLWGGIVNETRNLVRMGTIHFPHDRELLRDLTRWTALFPYAAMHSLRGVKAVGREVPGFTDAELARAEAAQHPVLAVATRMSECLQEARRRGYVTDFVQMAADQNVQLLIDYLGGCERIRKTPLPFAYVVHLRRALVVYCFTLPFALVETYGWTTILDVLMVSYVFFGIEEIGVEIEGPFGFDDNDLPLEAISQTIRDNVLALAAATSPETGTPAQP